VGVGRCEHEGLARQIRIDVLGQFLGHDAVEFLGDDALVESVHLVSDLVGGMNKVDPAGPGIEEFDLLAGPGGDDLVVFDITDDEIIHKYNNVRYIPFYMIISGDYIDKNEINIGEDGFMLGMFADHYGETRNLIAARFGNISLMADELAPIKQPNKSVRPSFLFDLRSRPGFSGSPVFVYRTPAGDLRYASERGRDAIERISRRAEHDRLSRDPRWARRLHDEDDHSEQIDHIHENTFLMLLGVHCGQSLSENIMRGCIAFAA
jgi:hypothetical protein